MIIDWFHRWLDDTLYSVAKGFLSDVDPDNSDPEVAVQFIANAYSRVIQVSVDYLEAELRSNYATPKWFLELISLFKAMFENTGLPIINNSQHFSKGLNGVMEEQNDEAAEIQANRELLEFTVNQFKHLTAVKADLGLSELVWTTTHHIEVELQKWKNTL
jgi:dynein heavy chain